MVTAVAVAVAVLAAWECDDHRLVRRLGGRPWVPSARARWGLGWPAAGLWAAATYAAAMADGRRGFTLALVVGIAAWAGWGLGLRSRRRRAAARARVEVAGAADALCSLLGVGAIPAAALASAAQDHPVLAQAAAEQDIGGEVPGALRRGADLPGREGLAELAGAWLVCARTGASLALAMDTIADDLGRRQELASSVRIELAASRTAGRLLAGLPLVGLGLGYGFGGDPVAFLTSNVIGEVCLVLASALTAGGLVWTDVLADRAAR